MGAQVQRDFDMAKPYYLTQSSSGIFYVRYRNVLTGKLGTAKSTRCSNKKEAELQAMKWLAEGSVPGDFRKTETSDNKILKKDIIGSLQTEELTLDDAKQIINILIGKKLVESAVFTATPSSQNFIEYLLSFWTFDTSPYVKERLHSGHQIHKAHVKNCYNAVKTYWNDHFKDRSLGSIRLQDIKKFRNDLIDTGLSGGRINAILRAGTTALKFAYYNELTENKCFTGFSFCSAQSKKRAILTVEQASAVFDSEWRDNDSKLANLVAFATGMRASEIRALRLEDIGEDRLYVRHSYSEVDGLKCCKNGDSREVPIVPYLRTLLLNKARRNPHNQGLQGFVFYGLRPHSPIDERVWLKDLRRVLENLGFSNPKKITFHAWRHLYVTRMSDYVDAKTLQKATGHKTQEMIELYSNHYQEEDFAKLKVSSKLLFTKLLQFTSE